MTNYEIEYEKLKNLILVAKKEKKADLLIKNAMVINVFDESIEKMDIAIYDNRIAGIGNYREGNIIIDAQTLYVSPTFIDSHLHIESTKLTPFELAKAIIPLGTGTIVADPHEIANVFGVKGIEFLLECSKTIPLEIFFLAPSCVPATSNETNYRTLNYKNLIKLKKYPSILGLAEVMNYPGILNYEKELLYKIISFKNKIIDGHCPKLSKENLNAYICSGIYSDHECTTKEEALEKLSKGMFIMIREGSVTKDLLNLLPIINDKNKNRILLCTDDKDPDDIISNGHINHSLSLLVDSGISLPVAIKLATINPAQFFGFKQKGGIAPGYHADLVIFQNLKSIKYVIKDGKIIYEDGSLNEKYFINNINKAKYSSIKNTIHLKNSNDKILIIKDIKKRIRAIGLRKDSVITDEIQIEPTIKDGLIVSDTDKDIIKIAVFERHHNTGNFGLGFISGLKLKSGAFASSIAHDSHNIVVVGENDSDMLNALNHIRRIKGGIAISKDNKIIADLPLPYAGLISNMSVYDLAKRMKELRTIANEINKIEVDDPFMLVSFMTLSVIPSLKITDKGLFDVENFRFVSLYVD